MTSPAQVSGPGALSKRTDAPGQPIRNLPDPKYGEAGEYAAIQKAAPLAEAQPGPTGPSPSSMARQLASGGPEPTAAPAPEPRPLPGLFDAGDPSVPVTTGAPMGPGRNEIVGGGAPVRQRRVSESLAEYAQGDEALTSLVNMLSAMGQ